MNNKLITQYVLTAAVLAASWWCLIGIPGSDGKLQGGYAIKATVEIYYFFNPELKECK